MKKIQNVNQKVNGYMRSNCALAPVDPIYVLYKEDNLILGAIGYGLFQINFYVPSFLHKRWHFN